MVVGMIETAQGWIGRLGLQPLDREGGYYREVSRSDESLDGAKLPVRYATPRALYSSIYYLVTPESCSRLHRLQSDELWTFVAGDPVHMLLLYETGTGQEIRLGNTGAADMEAHLCVPRRVWQGCSLESGGRFALLTTVVAPGYDRLDFETGRRDELIATYPAFEERITALTRTEADGDATSAG